MANQNTEYILHTSCPFDLRAALTDLPLCPLYGWLLLRKRGMVSTRQILCFKTGQQQREGCMLPMLYKCPQLQQHACKCKHNVKSLVKYITPNPQQCSKLKTQRCKWVNPKQQANLRKQKSISQTSTQAKRCFHNCFHYEWGISQQI